MCRFLADVYFEFESFCGILAVFVEHEQWPQRGRFFEIIIDSVWVEV